MESNQKVTHLIPRLWHHLSPRRRTQFGLTLVLMVLTSFAEIISIGVILPFLSVLSTPEIIFRQAAAKPIIQALGLTRPLELVLPLAIAFCVAAVTAGAMRLMLLWVSTQLANAAGADLSLRIYHRTLYQSYVVHCSRNSSEVIAGIWSKTSDAIGTLNSTLNLISSAFMFIGILIALLAIDPIIASISVGGFGLIYALVILLTRKRLRVNSQINARQSTKIIKYLQEGLGGIRDVLIDGTQSIYCDIYTKNDRPWRKALGKISFISSSPRHIVESLGLVLIAAVAYSLSQQMGGLARSIPTIGALALGAQRLLPILQQAYSAWSGIQGGQASLQDILQLLDQPLPDYADQPAPQPLAFKHNISLRNVAFRYNPQTPYILRNINLIIAKGGRVGFIGTTGSGKSTLLDIVMGLLVSTNGTLEIDGQAIASGNCRAWQAHIAHVPQAIFLADSTVEENIAFGVPKEQIDRQRVRQAAEQAQLSDSIEGWPEQYQTFVGERGIRLSGGQRQRIGIARALYKKADVIIFDEATSALDNETEQSVMKAIEGLSKDITLLIIAHRITTLKGCTQVVELAEGAIKQIGTYMQVVGNHATLQTNT